MEELTTEGDIIPKIKLHENIHRNFLCTLGEENSEVEGKEYEAPQKRERGKGGKLFLIPNPEVVSYLKSLQMCMLELNLEKKQASQHATPAPQTGNEKGKKEEFTHKKQLIPIMD